MEKNQSGTTASIPAKTPAATDDLTQIERQMLCFATAPGARPLTGWKSCKYYEGLVRKGYCEELAEPNFLFRHFVLTTKGRAAIMEMVNAKNA